MQFSYRSTFRTVPLIALAIAAVAEAQSTVTVSPFVSYVPSAAANPLAGFSLTFGGTTGLALRSGAELSISTPDSSAQGRYRPWGADADVMLFLGGLGGGATVFSRALSPYLFSGIGMNGGDSSGTNVVHHGWSYGLGATLPLGLDADLFAEGRWRMSQYVLPTSHDAPASKSEMRFGLSFHVGGGSAEPELPRPRRGRSRYSELQDEERVEPQVVYVPTPAPAPAPQTVIVQQAPPPVVVVQQPPEPSTNININLPGSIVLGSRRTRHGSVYLPRVSPTPVTVTPTNQRLSTCRVGAVMQVSRACVARNR